MEDTLMTVKQYEAARCGHWQGLGYWELAGMGESLSFREKELRKVGRVCVEGKGVETSPYHPSPGWNMMPTGQT